MSHPVSTPTPACITEAQKIVSETEAKTAFVRAHFHNGRPNNSSDSTTEGTVKALGLLLTAYKKFNPA